MPVAPIHERFNAYSLRFPPPWTVDEAAESFRISDANGLAVAYAYSRRRRTAANLLARDEAGRIAANIAKLPELLKRPQY